MYKNVQHKIESHAEPIQKNEFVEKFGKQLSKLICEGTQKAGICSPANFFDCKGTHGSCNYCTILADFLIKHDVIPQEWTPASEPPAPGIPVIVSYIAWGTKDEIHADDVAFVTEDGTWTWWEGSAEDSEETCKVPITHWMPLPKAVSTSEKLPEEGGNRTKYDIIWRNVIIKWVNWEKSRMGIKIGNMKECVLDFSTLQCSSSSDIQAIKMICDRLITQMYRAELQNNGRANTRLQEYVSDILAHPYEWSTKL